MLAATLTCGSCWFIDYNTEWWGGVCSQVMQLPVGASAAAAASACLIIVHRSASAAAQGLTLVHSSAQPEPVLSLKILGPPSVSHGRRF